MDEKEIKAMVLDRLLQTGQIGASSLVFNEMHLAKKNRRIDLGYVRLEEMIAIEVKSEKDSLFRLEGQVLEYRKYFDRVVVVAAPKFSAAVMTLVDDDVAVWEVSSCGIRVVRRGRLIKESSKNDYLSLMTKREVSQVAKKLDIAAEKFAMYELKIEVLKKISKISKADMKTILLDGVHKRFGMASNRFLSKVIVAGAVSSSDVTLLSPYLLHKS
ncbi:sce7726 family protein [Pseudomonas caspiana]|uniref:sce7726 family protein n=1 Tax=Pseudomonas caspiana TaxID=1451454 RepID=UPI0032EFFC75